MDADRQVFAERRLAHAGAPSRFDHTRIARLRQLLARRPYLPDARLLDLGCSDGQLLVQAIEPRPDERLVGLDSSLPALQAARTRAIAPVRTQVGARLPFRDETFATVLAADVIEHVFDTQAVMDELARVLRPRGWLAMTTPNLVALSGRVQRLLGRSPRNVELDAALATSGHLRSFTFETLELLERRAGLRPLGRWTNVVHFSELGSSELVGRLRPSLGETLISLAEKPA
jgi:SAM-dependent methyltransferase